VIPRTVMASLTLVGAACHTAPPPWHDPSPHTVRLVAIAPRVSLEVLDWGGEGPPLVLLPGLGNTAHVFDDFAPALSDKHHVYGITPRGFGYSGGLPDTDVPGLLSDLTITLDSLHLVRVVLVGHSISGAVLTTFGESYRDRCEALVYLDAASDPTDSFAAKLDSLSGPAIRRPPMTSADSASPATVESYFARNAARFPMAELRAIARFDSAGKYAGLVGSDSSAMRIGALLKSRKRPAYSRLRCPSLAIFAVPDSVAASFPWYTSLDSAGRGQALAYWRVFAASLESDRDQFRREAEHSDAIDFHGASHWVFLSNREQTLAALRSFLLHNRAGEPAEPN
jgi:pimeloyl-ACP methyl ester carboxylesterase